MIPLYYQGTLSTVHDRRGRGVVVRGTYVGTRVYSTHGPCQGVADPDVLRL